jgi:hypothetical protein
VPPADALLNAVETTLRAVLSYAFNWLLLPPLMPPALLQTEDPAPAADPDEAAAPAERSTDGAAQASSTDTAAVAALVLVGRAILDDDEHKKQTLPG